MSKWNVRAVEVKKKKTLRIGICIHAVQKGEKNDTLTEIKRKKNYIYEFKANKKLYSFE